MGRRYFAVVLIVFLGLFAFAETGEQEEVDFLLFRPNSANDFVDVGRAMIQLDNMAEYLVSKKPNPGEIYVYGYTANVANDIDSGDLSKARAQLVIDELGKRGVARELFADPVAYGPVDMWGNNINEDDRILNRRVRILLDGAVLTPELVGLEPVAEPVLAPVEPESVITVKDDGETAKLKFPWLILLLLLPLAVLLFLLFKRKRSATDARPAVVPALPVSVVTTGEMTVNLDEEIRFRAYDLYLLRYGQNEDEIDDWHRAVTEVCGRYGACGYRTYRADGSWWAKKTMVFRK